MPTVICNISQCSATCCFFNHLLLFTFLFVTHFNGYDGWDNLKLSSTGKKALVGHFYTYAIPFEGFECDLTRVQVVEKNLRDLPEWINFNPIDGQITGVPQQIDVGIYQLVFIGIGKNNNSQEFICRFFAKSVIVEVEPFSLPHSLNNYFGNITDHNIAKSTNKLSNCESYSTIVIATLVVHHKYVYNSGNLTNFARHLHKVLNISIGLIQILRKENSLLFFKQLKKISILHSEGSVESLRLGDSIYISWPVTCGAFNLDSYLRHNIHRRSVEFSSDLSIGGFHLISGNNDGLLHLRKRRAVFFGSITALEGTPTETIALPSHVATSFLFSSVKSSPSFIDFTSLGRFSSKFNHSITNGREMHTIYSSRDSLSNISTSKASIFTTKLTAFSIFRSNLVSTSNIQTLSNKSTFSQGPLNSMESMTASSMYSSHSSHAVHSNFTSSIANPTTMAHSVFSISPLVSSIIASKSLQDTTTIYSTSLRSSEFLEGSSSSTLATVTNDLPASKVPTAKIDSSTDQSFSATFSFSVTTYPHSSSIVYSKDSTRSITTPDLPSYAKSFNPSVATITVTESDYSKSFLKNTTAMSAMKVTSTATVLASNIKSTFDPIATTYATILDHTSFKANITSSSSREFFVNSSVWMATKDTISYTSTSPFLTDLSSNSVPNLSPVLSPSILEPTVSNFEATSILRTAYFFSTLSMNDRSLISSSSATTSTSLAFKTPEIMPTSILTSIYSSKYVGSLSPSSPNSIKISVASTWYLFPASSVFSSRRGESSSQFNTFRSQSGYVSVYSSQVKSSINFSVPRSVDRSSLLSTAMSQNDTKITASGQSGPVSSTSSHESSQQLILSSLPSAISVFSLTSKSGTVIKSSSSEVFYSSLSFLRSVNSPSSLFTSRFLISETSWRIATITPHYTAGKGSILLTPSLLSSSTVFTNSQVASNNFVSSASRYESKETISTFTSAFGSMIFTTPSSYDSRSSLSTATYSITVPLSVFTLMSSLSTATKLNVSIFGVSTSAKLQSFNSLSTSPTPNAIPRVLNSIGRITAYVGRLFVFKIPYDTFYDSDDGYSGNLKLKCQYANGNLISDGYWIRFDNGSQTISGLPMQTDYDLQINKAIELEIVAFDKEGNSVRDAFSIYIEKKSVAFTYSATATIQFNYTTFIQDGSLRVQLFNRIIQFLNTSNFQDYYALPIRNGSVIFSWSDTSSTTCNKTLISSVVTKLQLPSGSPTPEFLQALLPEFPLISFSYKYEGSCMLPFTVKPNPSGPNVEQRSQNTFVTFVVPLLAVAFILAIVIAALVCYSKRRRANPLFLDKYTFKRGQPVLLPEEHELKIYPPSAVILPEDYMYEKQNGKDKLYGKSDKIFDDEDGLIKDTEAYDLPDFKYPPPPYNSDLKKSNSRTDYESPYLHSPPTYQLPPLYIPPDDMTSEV